jgi:voltage-gated potassium channel Kch
MKDALEKVWKGYLARRHSVLFFSLLLSLAVSPLLSAMGLEARFVELFLLLNLLLAGLVAEGASRRLFLVVLLVAIGIRVASEIQGGSGLLHGSAFALAGLMLFAAVGALRDAMRSVEVDAEHIYAALSAYLLTGFFFGVLAATLEQTVPGSYVGFGVESPGAFTVDRAIYFSFVTLATLGYGDIVPATDLARGLAIVEAVTGQLYIAVLVARLVSGYRGKERS